MYLHIGNGKNIRKRDIIGIFDMDTATVSAVSRGYIKRMERDKLIEYDDSDIPRSFILLRREQKITLKGKERLKNLKNIRRSRDVYINLSKISTSSLKARVNESSYTDYDLTDE